MQPDTKVRRFKLHPPTPGRKAADVARKHRPVHPVDAALGKGGKR